MNITKQIIHVLVSQGKVVIPGIGNIELIHVPSRHAQDGSIEPPTKVARFAAHVENVSSDELVRQVARQGQLTLEDARGLVGQFSQDIQAKTNQGDRVPVEGLGVFFLSADHKVWCELDSSLGEMWQLGLEAIPAAEQKDRKPKPAVQPVISQPVTAVVERKMKKKVPVLTWVLIILVLAGSGWLYWLNRDVVDTWVYSQTGKAFDTAAVFARGEEKPGPDHELAPVLNRRTDKKVALMYTNEQADSTHVVEDVTLPTDSGQIYHIIAGSFRRYENAERLMVDLKTKGYPAEVINPDGEMFRVSVKAFTNKHIAIDEMERMRSRFTNSIWVLSL